MPKEMNIGELNTLYDHSEEVDKRVFAEMRSNLLLVAGDHYSKKRRKREFSDRLRANKRLKEQDRLRLTKNHIEKINTLYVNNLVNNSPDVTILPQLETEVQDQKAAELNSSVWDDAKSRQKMPEKIRDFAEDFTAIGEVAVKLVFDPSKGNFLGYMPQMDESGQPLVDEMGQSELDMENPKFEGDIPIERIFPFDLMRAPEAKSMEESPYIIYRKMVGVKQLKAMFPDEAKAIQKTTDDTFLIYDVNRSDYRKSKDEAMVREFYYRPSQEYPQGYYFITIHTAILGQGELPYGIFPIIWKSFQKIPTSPRGISKIKHLRPYQVEINRCASAIATHQVTLGDDKIITNNTSKIEQGAMFPGVRVIKTNGGGNFSILPGRSGEQYLGYMQAQIAEMYDIANLKEEAVDQQLTADAFQNLYSSIKQKRKFSVHVQKFEEFLVDIAKTYLDLARHYFDEQRVIRMVGKNEQVNISEFKQAGPLQYKIKVEPQTEDIDLQMGKQLVMNNALQFVGSQLDPSMIGKILKNMPFSNAKDTFDEFTIDEDNARNEILALERGQLPQTSAEENHKYTIKKLTHRMKQSDFQFLDPQIQQAFQQKRQEHSQIEAQQQQAIQAAQAGFIPTGGGLVKVDFYVDKGEGKTTRAVVPFESISWLLQKIQEQGLSQENLNQLQTSAQAEISQQMRTGAAIPQGN